MRTMFVVLGCVFVAGDQVLPTLTLDELTVAVASSAVCLAQLPLLHPTHGNVLTQEHVEGGVDGMQVVVADEDESVETIQDDADLGRSVPAIGAGARDVRFVETVTTTTTHGGEHSLAVGAEELVRRTRTIVDVRLDVELRGGQTAVLMTLEMAQVAETPLLKVHNTFDGGHTLEQGPEK